MACLRLFGNIRDLDDRAPFLAEFADQSVVGAVDAQRNFRVVFGQRFERWQGGIDDGGGVADQQQDGDQ